MDEQDMDLIRSAVKDSVRETIGLELDTICIEINELESMAETIRGNSQEDRNSVRAIVRRYERKIQKIDERILAIEKKVGLR